MSDIEKFANDDLNKFPELLKRRFLYLSDFLEKNRGLYYDNLMMVREKGRLLNIF